LVTEHAATICGVILGREHVVAAAARRVRDDLVEGLLLGRGRDDGDAQRWAAHLGYDPGREHNVMVIAFDIGDPRPPHDGETLRRIGRAGTVTAFADLGIHRLLLQVPQLAELRSFADDVLGSLSPGEHERRAEYLTTLACYLRENSSPQRAARFLHVHPNTVAYRIKRIEEITGLSMDSYRDRLTTQVALEILDALGDER